MAKINKFEKKLLDTICKYDMISKKDRVLVGLSGGKDSVALLYSLSCISHLFDLELVAFHLNHKIRGEEADEDERFSEEFAKKLGVRFVSSSVSVPDLMKESQGGIEAVAREVRYSEFSRVAKSEGCNKIATAHTASDNSETLFITLLRHSNPKGIPPVRDNIIRPLISHTTDEILEYCEENSLLFVTDKTNLDDAYLRNHIRLNVIPELSKNQPSLDDTLLKFTEIQRSNEELQKLVLANYLENNPDPRSLDSLKTLANNTALHNVLFMLLSSISSDVGAPFSYSHLKDTIALILNGRVGQRIQLDRDFFVIREYEKLKIDKVPQHPDNFSFEIKMGENRVPDSPFTLFLEKREDYEKRTQNNFEKSKNINKLTKNSLFKYNTMNMPLIARSRKEGDKMVLRGISRSLKKFMIDEKIPSHLRSRIPVVCDKEGIVWVSGLGLSDRISRREFPDGEELSLSLEISDF